MKIAGDKNQNIGSHAKSNALKHRMIQEHCELIFIPLPFGDYVLVNDDIEATIKRRGDKLKKQDLVADYKFVIDTKKDMQEVYGNIIGKSHARFRDELILAQKMGAKMVILIEEDGMHTLEDVLHWNNSRVAWYYKVKSMQERGKWLDKKLPSKPPVTNDILFKSMKTMESKYGCQFLFTTKRNSANDIIDLLGRYSKEC